jgi:hypothetical protein
MKHVFKVFKITSSLIIKYKRYLFLNKKKAIKDIIDIYLVTRKA